MHAEIQMHTFKQVAELVDSHLLVMSLTVDATPSTKLLMLPGRFKSRNQRHSVALCSWTLCGTLTLRVLQALEFAL